VTDVYRCTLERECTWTGKLTAGLVWEPKWIELHGQFCEGKLVRQVGEPEAATTTGAPPSRG